MSCGFKAQSYRLPRNAVMKRKYRSLYLGDVEVPPVLETTYNGITIKVIDAKQYRLNLNYPSQ